MISLRLFNSFKFGCCVKEDEASAIVMTSGGSQRRQLADASSLLESAVEHFRRCRNLCRTHFSGQTISALSNFCEQRLRLLEERRRLASLAVSVEECRDGRWCVVQPVSSGCSGVLSLFSTVRPPLNGSSGGWSCQSFFLVDAMLGQLEADIGALLSQLHRVLTQYKEPLQQLKDIAASPESARNVLTASALDFEGSEVLHALCSATHMVSDVYVWMSRAVAELKRTLADPHAGTEVAVRGLTWWDGRDAQPVDGDKAWECARKHLLSPVALVMFHSDSELESS